MRVAAARRLPVSDWRFFARGIQPVRCIALDIVTAFQPGQGSPGAPCSLPAVQETDALLVGGGDATYLCHWMRQSGLADLLPSLRAVWVGLSGGSMVMTPSIGADFVSWTRADSDGALGVVDFAIFPHLDHENFPDNSMASAEKWAASMPVPSYAIDDQTAIKVTDGTVEVVSEGHWKLFTP